MNWEELLQACATGLPYVESIVMVDGILGRRGKVTTVKDDGKFKGCGILWDGQRWETWYYSAEDTTRRRKVNEVRISEDQTTDIKWPKS